FFFFFSSRRRHTRFSRDWSSDVCSSDLLNFQYGDYTFSPTSDQKVSVRMSYDEENDLYSFTRIKRSVIWKNNQHNLLEELDLKRQDALFGCYTTNKIEFPNVFEWLSHKQEELVAKGYIIKQETGDKHFFIG